MSISLLQLPPQYAEHKQVLKQAIAINKLISELNKRDLSPDTIKQFDTDVSFLNQMEGTPRKMSSQIRKTRNKWLGILVKEYKLVSKGYYQNYYMAIGMTAIGLPLGVTLSHLLDKQAFIAIGLPLGLSIGMMYGTNLDRKAQEEGRQLKNSLIR